MSFFATSAGDGIAANLALAASRAVIVSTSAASTLAAASRIRLREGDSNAQPLAACGLNPRVELPIDA